MMHNIGRFPLKRNGRDSTKLKRPPCAKGAPAQRVGDCNTIIFKGTKLKLYTNNPSVSATRIQLPLLGGAFGFGYCAGTPLLGSLWVWVLYWNALTGEPLNLGTALERPLLGEAFYYCASLISLV